MMALELPIILSAEEVRAVLDGTKTQARLPIENPPPDTDPPTDWGWHEHGGLWYAYDADYPGGGHYDAYSCPFGKPGDRLWVAEPWGSALGPFGESVVYLYQERHGEAGGPYLSAGEMSRKASRVTLGVKRVWIERVHGISENDARSEGATHRKYQGRWREEDGWCLDWSPVGQPSRTTGGPLTEGCIALGTPRMAFASAWNSIYAAKGLGWDANPRVWCGEFERVKS